MADLEHLTITLPADMAAVIKGAIEDGDFACSSDVIRAALRDWKVKRAMQLEELAVLRADIQLGLDDIAAGRMFDFDVSDIARRGRERSAARHLNSD